MVARCPGVLEVAAVAQADEHSGEVVALFVVRKDPSLTEQAVKDCCHESLTDYKRPQAIYFRDELPKTNVGKILRRALRDELAKQGDAAASRPAGVIKGQQPPVMKGLILEPDRVGSHSIAAPTDRASI